MQRKRKADNVVEPPIRISKELTERYVRLYKGVRSRKDPITWRTFIIETKILLGSHDPDNRSLSSGKFNRAKKLLDVLLKGTFMENIKEEIYIALGFEKFVKGDADNLDALLINAHHSSEPLLWTLADEYKRRGKKVAVINPVGHYSDRQIRILSVGGVVRDIKRVVILSSTQFTYGGSITVLSNTIRTLRNVDLATKINEVDIVFPMFGGSRGHRPGQSHEIGYEVLEAIFNAKILALITEDLIEKLEDQIGELTPKFRFFSVDIHSMDYPAKVFAEEGLDFKSISPATDMAKEAYKVIKEKRLLSKPIRLVACDMGAISRTESLAKALLVNKRNGLKSVDVVYIRKTRERAGVVRNIKVEKVIRWKMLKSGITHKRIKHSKVEKGEYILFYSDDMIDTGGTAKKDIKLLKRIYPNARLKIYAATHPVLSSSSDTLDDMGADVYLLGNTLNPLHLDEHPKVRIVDLAPSIYMELEKKL